NPSRRHEPAWFGPDAVARGAGGVCGGGHDDEIALAIGDVMGCGGVHRSGGGRSHPRRTGVGFSITCSIQTRAPIFTAFLPSGVLADFINCRGMTTAMHLEGHLAAFEDRHLLRCEMVVFVCAGVVRPTDVGSDRWTRGVWRERVDCADDKA